MTPSALALQVSKSADVHACAHCGLPVPSFRAGRSEGEPSFCCEGCRTVYQILTGHDLQEYYAIKKQSEHFAKSQPASSVISRYSYLDEPAVKDKFAYGGGRCMDFYIEGVHCVACLWLIERIGRVVPGVQSVQMSLGSLVAKVSLDDAGAFAPVAEGLERIGYKPHPVSEGRQADDLNHAENRREMIRIGVAGFCMMNIMILFVSIYAGADAGLLQFFRWLSGALFLPVAVYGAAPFYRGALSALKARQMNIDLPVAGALLLGSAASLWNLITGSEHVYFDSLTAFVFLLLSARYALKTLYQKTASQTGAGEFLIPKSALRYNLVSRMSEVTAVESVLKGEYLLVPQGEVVAADGEVAEGAGYADFHMISGESEPVKLQQGSKVFAGSVNVGPDLIIKVSAVGAQTRIERLLQSAAGLEKPKTVQMADAAAKRYLAAVFIGAVGLIVSSYRLSFTAAFDRALSMIIIACPCALALATPLAYRMASRASARIGVLLKSVSALDKLSKAKKLYLDKTGTLTHGRFEVLQWTVLSGAEDFIRTAYLLEKKSAHPIALALRDYAHKFYADPGEGLEVQDWREVLGSGVSGRVKNKHYEIKGAPVLNAQAEASASAVRSCVGIYEDGVQKVRIDLGDRIREDSREAIQRLQRQFESVTMITGDRPETAQAVAAELSIPSFTAQMSPESKKELLSKDPFSLMVGDGANDAGAMKAASISVAVQGSIETSFQCADAYLTVPGLSALPELIAIARRTRKVVWTALLVSLAYNLSGMVLALLGFVTPLVAAVVMPLSSFTVLAIAYIGINWRLRI